MNIYAALKCMLHFTAKANFNYLIVKSAALYSIRSSYVCSVVVAVTFHEH